MKVFRLGSAAFSLASVLLLATVSTLAQKNTAAELPSTKLGALVGEWITLIENGSEKAIAKFVENSFSSAGKSGDGAREAIYTMRKLHLQSGGLEILTVTPPNGPFGLTLTVKAKRGDNYARIAIGEDDREPGKIIGFGIWRVEPPNIDRSIKWPDKPLNEAALIKEIERQVALRANEGRFSGVVLIARDDEVLLQVAHGMAERSFGVKNALNTKFNLASVGKMFTATAIAQLVKQGRLSYDDKLIEHLPDFPRREAAEKITIHQLLTHTAGMGTLFGSPDYQRLRRYRNSWDEVSAFANEKLFFEPGKGWRYSNAGYVTLGAVIERISGMDYIDYVRKNVFKPLEMNDTGYYAHDEVVPNLSVLYVRSPDDPLGLEPYVADHILAGYRGNAEGGGYATAMDLFKFARSYRTGELLGEKAQAALVDVKVDEDGKGARFYGYGLQHSVINGETVRGHSGGGRTHLQMLWDSGYTVIVMTNTVPPPATDLSGEIVRFITKQKALER